MYPIWGEIKQEKSSHPLSPMDVSTLKNVDDFMYYPKTKENYLYTNYWKKLYVLESQAIWHW